MGYPLVRVRKRRLNLFALVAVLIGIVSGLTFFPWSQGVRVITAWDAVLLHPAETVKTQRTLPGRNTVALVQKPSDGLPAGMVLGYFYDPGNAQSAVGMLQHYVPMLSGVIPFWYKIYANGSVSGNTNPQVLTLARQHNLWTFALVRNMAGNSVFGPLLNNPAACRRAIENLLTLVEANGYDGVNLDWEGIAASERHRFTEFVKELSQVFHQHGYYVTLSLPAETANNPQNSWTGAYDYKKLGQYADLLMIMAYDQHWAGGSPGPIASQQWVRSVLNYTVTQVPPKKVILGIPGYGYNWGSNGAVALSYGQAHQLARQYASSSSKNHFVYVQNGQVHSVWFENAASLLNKIQLVSGYELRGIALWRLGIEDPKLWYLLQ